MYLGIVIFSPSIAIAQWFGAILGCLTGCPPIFTFCFNLWTFISSGGRTICLLRHLYWGLVLFCSSNRSFSHLESIKIIAF